MVSWVMKKGQLVHETGKYANLPGYHVFLKKILLLSLLGLRPDCTEADPDSEAEKMSEVTQEVGSQWDCQTWHGWKTMMQPRERYRLPVAANIMKSSLDIFP